MTLTEYRVRWFDNVWWRWREWDVLAENEDQVRTIIDKECDPVHRYKPHQRGVVSVDSLSITVIGEPASPPFITHTDL